MKKDRKEYYKVYQSKNKERRMERYHANRGSFLKNKRCEKCGEQSQLEIDHINPLLKVSHCVWLWSEEKRNIELKKCQVLCRACHMEKTGNENRKEHSYSSYKLGRCRCSKCFLLYRKSYDAYNEKRREKRKRERLVMVKT